MGFELDNIGNCWSNSPMSQRIIKFNVEIYVKTEFIIMNSSLDFNSYMNSCFLKDYLPQQVY